MTVSGTVKMTGDAVGYRIKKGKNWQNAEEEHQITQLAGLSLIVTSSERQ